jgi:hypothetical protein
MLTVFEGVPNSEDKAIGEMWRSLATTSKADIAKVGLTFCKYQNDFKLWQCHEKCRFTAPRVLSVKQLYKSRS